VVGGSDGLIATAEARVDQLERRWSRFLDDSEVSALNRHAGTFVPVSADTLTLIRRAVDAWRLSGGAFDPTVLGDMIRAGYERPFDLLDGVVPPGRSLLGVGVADIVIDGDRVCLPAGTGFDPGGIGKGLAADLICAELMAAGAEGVCVNLGGDVRVVGTGPDGPWTVGVEHPWSAEPVALIGLADGAVATTTTLRRRWQTDGHTHHHVIDPQTGRPSDTDLTLATVVAAHAWVAEILAKAVLLAGSAHPFDILGGTGVQALTVDDRGRIDATPAFADYQGQATRPAQLAMAGCDQVGASSKTGPRIHPDASLNLGVGSNDRAQ
jgi:FAD:protein FMN transferase